MSNSDFSPFWGWEVLDTGSGLGKFWQCPSSWLAAGSFLPCHMEEGMRELWGGSFIRTPVPFMKTPPSWLTPETPPPTGEFGEEDITCRPQKVPGVARFNWETYPIVKKDGKNTENLGSDSGAIDQGLQEMDSQQTQYTEVLGKGLNLGVRGGFPSGADVEQKIQSSSGQLVSLRGRVSMGRRRQSSGVSTHEPQWMEHRAVLCFQTQWSLLPWGEKPPKPQGQRHHRSLPATCHWQVVESKTSAAWAKKGLDDDLRIYVTWVPFTRASRMYLQVTL